MEAAESRPNANQDWAEIWFKASCRASEDATMCNVIKKDS